MSESSFWRALRGCMWTRLRACVMGGVVIAVVTSLMLVSSRAGAQERSAAPEPIRTPALLDSLGGSFGGFFNGLIDTFHRAAGLSLIARDWDAAQLLTGHLAPIDQVMRERSRRMLLARRRFFADGPITPFIQIGLGQWRVDPDMPGIPHDVVIAGQFGSGIEFALSRWAALALEGECTVINPARSDARWIKAPALWGSFLAARTTF